VRPWVLILLLAAAVNLNILANGFVYDDGANILNNPYLRGPQFLPKIFTTNLWGFMGPKGVSNYYRPLTHVMNMGTVAVFGHRPWGYQLVKLLLHLGSCILVYRIGRKLYSERVGFWGGLLFAVHPIHTEAVAWANNDLAFSLLALAAFELYISGRDVWAAALFLPALLTKETSVMLLPLMAIYQWRRSLWYFSLPLGLYLALRINALGGLTMVQNEYVLPVDQQLMSTIFLAGNYVYRLIWPLPFSVYHVFYPVTTPADPRLCGARALGLCCRWSRCCGSRAWGTTSSRSAISTSPRWDSAGCWQRQLSRDRQGAVLNRQIPLPYGRGSLLPFCLATAY